MNRDDTPPKQKSTGGFTKSWTQSTAKETKSWEKVDTDVWTNLEREVGSSSYAQLERCPVDGMPFARRWSKILAALESDPRFQVTTFDGTAWIDPFTGKVVEAPFDLKSSILEYFHEKGSWMKERMHSVQGMRTARWYHFLARNTDRDDRWLTFDSFDRWINPFTGDPVPGIDRVPEHQRKKLFKNIAKHLSQTGDLKPSDLDKARVVTTGIHPIITDEQRITDNIKKEITDAFERRASDPASSNLTGSYKRQDDESGPTVSTGGFSRDDQHRTPATLNPAPLSEHPFDLPPITDPSPANPTTQPLEETRPEASQANQGQKTLPMDGSGKPAHSPQDVYDELFSSDEDFMSVDSSVEEAPVIHSRSPYPEESPAESTTRQGLPRVKVIDFTGAGRARRPETIRTAEREVLSQTLQPWVAQREALATPFSEPVNHDEPVHLMAPLPDLVKLDLGFAYQPSPFPGADMALVRSIDQNTTFILCATIICEEPVRNLAATSLKAHIDGAMEQGDPQDLEAVAAGINDSLGSFIPDSWSIGANLATLHTGGENLRIRTLCCGAPRPVQLNPFSRRSLSTIGSIGPRLCTKPWAKISRHLTPFNTDLPEGWGVLFHTDGFTHQGQRGQHALKTYLTSGTESRSLEARELATTLAEEHRLSNGAVDFSMIALTAR